ncbi:two-component system activity regulator YycH, partial [Staphylococcus epidermidis]|uniref:two-component system activity regulator YycH n=1 Tax=Staphylococcus epidermidis TaxID=1282 RepID=UPI0021B21B3C
MDEDDNKEVVVFGIRKEGDEVVKVKRRMKGNNVDKGFKSMEGEMEGYREMMRNKDRMEKGREVFVLSTRKELKTYRMVFNM